MEASRPERLVATFRSGAGKLAPVPLARLGEPLPRICLELRDAANKPVQLTFPDERHAKQSLCIRILESTAGEEEGGDGGGAGREALLQGGFLGATFPAEEVPGARPAARPGGRGRGRAPEPQVALSGDKRGILIDRLM